MFIAIVVIVDLFLFPIVLVRAHFEISMFAQGPNVWLPIAWLASLVAVFPVASALYTILFGDMVAVKIVNGRLIYLNSFYTSIRLTDVAGVEAVERRRQGLRVDYLIVNLVDGKKKFIPLSVLDRKPPQVIRTILNERMANSQD